MPRFVILTHDWPQLHWDFMLERGESLQTWRLETEPVLEQWITAISLPDHRLEYLDYEGPVSGERGSVTLFYNGNYTIKKEFPKEFWLQLEGNRGIWDCRILDEGNKVRFLLTQPVRQRTIAN